MRARQIIDTAEAWYVTNRLGQVLWGPFGETAARRRAGANYEVTATPDDRPFTWKLFSGARPGHPTDPIVVAGDAAGERLFGDSHSGYVSPGQRVVQLTRAEMMGYFDTFDFAFDPATGDAWDVADQAITPALLKRITATDGKVYVSSQAVEGVAVFS